MIVLRMRHTKQVSERGDRKWWGKSRLIDFLVSRKAQNKYFAVWSVFFRNLPEKSIIFSRKLRVCATRKKILER